MRLLAGDIGGTNSRLVLYDCEDDPIALRQSNKVSSHTLVSQKYYKNYEFESFSQVIHTFISHPDNEGHPIHSCCFAVAGPVVDNRINFTNREGWIVDGHAISEDFHIPHVQLINDFVANGYGLLSLSSHELVTLQQPPSQSPSHQCPIALLGAGTGLGECFLAPDSEGNLTAFPTEGGHVEFAPRTPLENELLLFIQHKLDPSPDSPADNDLPPRVSVERLVSGMGLENIYEFLRSKFPDQVDHAFDHRYNEANERGRLIGAEKYNYGLFKRAVEIMLAIYGGEAGNMGLKYLPYGGIFVAGGIAPKHIELLTSHESLFMQRFWDKGRMSSIMKDFPVHVVMNEELGLRGAHIVAARNAAKVLDGPKRVTDMDRAVVEKGFNDPKATSFSDAVRDAFARYPVAFTTVLSGTTAALSAAAVVATLVTMRKSRYFTI